MVWDHQILPDQQQMRLGCSSCVVHWLRMLRNHHAKWNMCNNNCLCSSTLQTSQKCSTRFLPALDGPCSYYIYCVLPQTLLFHPSLCSYHSHTGRIRPCMGSITRTTYGLAPIRFLQDNKMCYQVDYISTYHTKCDMRTRCKPNEAGWCMHTETAEGCRVSALVLARHAGSAFVTSKQPSDCVLVSPVPAMRPATAAQTPARGQACQGTSSCRWNRLTTMMHSPPGRRA